MCGASENIMNVDIVVPNQTRYLSLIGNIAEQIAKQLDTGNGDRDTLAYHLDLALTEAMANAIQHGCPADTQQSVRVCLSFDDKTLCVKVFDHGQGFDLEAVTTRARHFPYPLADGFRRISQDGEWQRARNAQEVRLSLGASWRSPEALIVTRGGSKMPPPPRSNHALGRPSSNHTRSSPATIAYGKIVVTL